MQEPSVSSSTSEREGGAQVVGAPNKGILKQRGTTLQKSKSASNIISLKAPQVLRGGGLNTGTNIEQVTVRQHFLYFIWFMRKD